MTRKLPQITGYARRLPALLLPTMAANAYFDGFAIGSAVAWATTSISWT